MLTILSLWRVAQREKKKGRGKAVGLLVGADSCTEQESGSTGWPWVVAVRGGRGDRSVVR